jgi:hypothetical protein
MGDMEILTIPEMLGLDPLSWSIGVFMGIFIGFGLLMHILKSSADVRRDRLLPPVETIRGVMGPESVTIYFPSQRARTLFWMHFLNALWPHPRQGDTEAFANYWEPYVSGEAGNSLEWVSLDRKVCFDLNEAGKKAEARLRSIHNIIIRWER